MTDGILLAETPRDRFLNQYDTIILDEAHERSLNIDFLLGYMKTLVAAAPGTAVHHHVGHDRRGTIQRAFSDRSGAGPGHRSLGTQLPGGSAIPASGTETMRVRNRI